MPLTAEEARQLDVVSTIWPKIGCIVKAVAKFIACETTSGHNCGDTLVADIRNCFK